LTTPPAYTYTTAFVYSFQESGQPTPSVSIASTTDTFT